MKQEKQQEIALMRYRTIAPLIAGLDENYPSKSAFYTEISAKGILGPDGKLHNYAPATIEKWYLNYQKHGFAVLGIVGVDRSPCCGVNTTSDQDRELPGRGVFIASLRAALESAGLTVPVIGIKPSAPEALDRVRSLLGE